MKKALFYILLLVMIIPGCSKSKSKIQEITYNDSAFIKIIVKEVTDTIEIQTNFCSIFPFRNCYYKTKTITEPGVYFISYKMTKPELVHFKIDKNFDALLLPRDTLVIEAGDKSDEFGKTKVYYLINDIFYYYFQKKFNKFGYYTYLDENIPAWEYLIKSEISLEEYNRAASILEQGVKEDIRFLYANNKNLPDWFTDLEKSNIVYGATYTKIRLAEKVKPHLQNNKLALNIEFYNPEARLSSIYYFTIMQYLYYSYPLDDNRLEGADRGLSIFTKQERAVDSLLTGGLHDYYLTCTLSDQYIMFCFDNADVQKVDSLMKNRNFGLSEDQTKFIMQERELSMKARNIKFSLDSGDKATGFYLKDELDAVRKLSDYRGKYVYLHFWATWCQPCIKGIPVINELYSKTSSKQFIIINICLDDNIEKWKEIIKRENLKGTNLICKGNWEKSLKEKYFIEELPHYTLIDTAGLIIENKTVRPGNFPTEISQLFD